MSGRQLPGSEETLREFCRSQGWTLHEVRLHEHCAHVAVLVSNVPVVANLRPRGERWRGPATFAGLWLALLGEMETRATDMLVAREVGEG